MSKDLRIQRSSTERGPSGRERRVSRYRAARPPHTSINGVTAVWPGPVWRAWLRRIQPLMREGEIVTYANYHYPTEFDPVSGKRERGFVYTLNDRHVCFLTITGEDLKK